MPYPLQIFSQIPTVFLSDLYDVNNRISRRAWARNQEPLFAIKREMERTPGLKVTLPELVDEDLLDYT